MSDEKLFTNEAERLIDEESKLLSDALREEAVLEALRARGRPIEVTASDVKRARGRFVKREPRLRPATDLLLRTYAVIGVIATLFGLSYPVIKKFLDDADPTYRTSLMIALAGMMFTALSVFVRAIMVNRSSDRARRRIEEEVTTEKHLR